MRIRHFAGYGTVDAKRVPDKGHTLHIRVVGDHEWGLIRRDEYDLFHWLVRRFDRSQRDAVAWTQRRPRIEAIPGVDDHGVETCDYLFDYDHA